MRPTSDEVRERIWASLASRRLALVLLGAIAALSALGTLAPSRESAGAFPGLFGAVPGPLARALGLSQTFRSPLFAFLVLAFAANIAVCTWRRLYPKGRLRSPRGTWVIRWIPRLDLGMHASLLAVVLAAAIRVATGSIGTLYLVVGYPTDSFFDWHAGADVPLGFGIVAREKREEYFPVRARIGVSEAATGRKLRLVEVTEGKRAEALPGGPLLEVLAYDEKSGLLRVGVTGGSGGGRVELATAPGAAASADFGPHRFSLVAFRRDLKSVRGRVAFVEGHEVSREEWLTPNSGLHYRGWRFSLTAWGADERGLPYVGLQAVRDPGEPLFWLACTALSLFTPGFLALRAARPKTGVPAGNDSPPARVEQGAGEAQKSA